MHRWPVNRAKSWSTGSVGRNPLRSLKLRLLFRRLLRLRLGRSQNIP